MDTPKLSLKTTSPIHNQQLQVKKSNLEMSLLQTWFDDLKQYRNKKTETYEKVNSLIITDKFDVCVVYQPLRTILHESNIACIKLFLEHKTP